MASFGDGVDTQIAISRTRGQRGGKNIRRSEAGGMKRKQLGDGDEGIQQLGGKRKRLVASPESSLRFPTFAPEEVKNLGVQAVID